MDNPPEADYPHIHRSVATTAFLEFYYIANLKAANRPVTNPGSSITDDNHP